MSTSISGELTEARTNSSPKRFGLFLTDQKVVDIGICLLLVLIVAMAFGRALGNGFVNYDDSDYVYDNSRITAGISFSGIIWAFTHVHAANWHPLTTISHMLDCQLYGLDPWGHHLTNVLLHALATVCLFLALRRLTTLSAQHSTLNSQPLTIWACAFVAALFAVHPLRVESVAWISERKDVLSGVFFMLTLLAYAKYVRHPGRDSLSRRRYLAVVLFFALGLLSKPTLVTLPFVLLLLDYWPLERWQSAKGKELGAGSTERGDASFSTIHLSTGLSRRNRMKAEASAKAERLNFSTSLGGLVVEKIPLFVLSAASCFATVIAQKKVIAANLKVGFGERLVNATDAYVAYLGDMFFPAHLSVSHPYDEQIKIVPFIGAAALLFIITAASFTCRRRYPFVLVGWLWYLGVLVPMIGFVQVSAQSRADRYTYLSQIGIYLIIAWGLAIIINHFRVKRSVVAIPATIIILILAFCSYAQGKYWHDTESLWRHALDASTFDYIAHDSLGYTLLQKGDINAAVAEYRRALEIKPDYADSHNNLGNALLQQGKIDEALEHYNRALAIEPNFPEPHNNLGNVYFKQNRIDEAIEQYKIAAAKRSEFAEVQYNLGSALIVKGDWVQAIPCFRKAIEIEPTYSQAHNKLGIALGATGQTAQAVSEFREALRLDPKYAEAHFNLGYVLGHTGQQREAIEHYLKAVRLRPDYPEAKQELRRLGLPTGQ